MKGQNNSFMRRRSFFSSADAAPDKAIAVQPDCKAGYQGKHAQTNSADTANKNAKCEAHGRTALCWSRQIEIPAIAARMQPIPSPAAMMMSAPATISIGSCVQKLCRTETRI